MHCHPIQTDAYLRRYPLTDNGSLLPVASHKPALLAVTMSPAEWRCRTYTSVEESGHLVWALGLHPWERQDRDQRALFLDLLPECDAVGEVGLDGSIWAGSDLDNQRENLIAILDSPHTKDRIVSVHGYEAHTELIEVLERHSCPGIVYHWFSADYETLVRAMALDLFFSVNRAMFSVEEGPRVVSGMPQSRVLVETDAPAIDRASARVLSPGSDKTDDRPLWPGDVTSVEMDLARLWQVDLAEVRHQLWRNLAELEGRLQRRPFSAATVLDQTQMT
jgi:Tat protein secretion system quality control protein TatD with DNase activity